MKWQRRGSTMIQITIDQSCCKGCEICLTTCIKNVFVKSKSRNAYGTAMPNVAGAKECILCRMCERLCPDSAINVEED